MFNFVEIRTTEKRRGYFTIEPVFLLSVEDSDLMTRAGDFYAVWDEESGLWRTNENFVTKTIDKMLWDTVSSIKKEEGCKYIPLLMKDSTSGMIDRFHKYCQKQLRDNYTNLDKNIIFANTVTTRTDYASKKLPYDLVEMETPCYDELMSTLYDEEDKQKLEWAMGSIIAGDSKWIEKFIVLYGEPGSGKSTFLNKILKRIFNGYWNAFIAKSLTSKNNAFALEVFKSNPLISIQTDGDLSRIEDNTLINSISGHEEIVINEKHKSQYMSKFDTMMFMGTNNPVKITDAKSGILRRLIDVYPSGRKIKPKQKYDKLVDGIKFELGGIAHKVLKVYEELGSTYYDAYVPLRMVRETNDFYDFIEYYYDSFEAKDYVVLQDVWELYKKYVEMAGVKYPLSRKNVQMELMSYFDEFKEQYFPNPDTHLRCAYLGFKKDKFIKAPHFTEKQKEQIPEWLNFGTNPSAFNLACMDYIAQLASPSGSPQFKWCDVTTKLSEIDTKKLHWVRIANPQHIVIDFDLKDTSGKKSLIKNIKAASKFPPTYAELSKSGSGIHLHYIYAGDVSELSPLFSDNIEVKVFSGKSSLRRQLTSCNALNIATISSGLPKVKKKEKPMVDEEMLVNEAAIIRRIQNCIKKKHHSNTRSEVDYIKASLDKAYESGITYDVSKLYQEVFEFAACSTNQSQYCMKLVPQMHFKSKDLETQEVKYNPFYGDKPFSDDAPIVFFDIEVFPNLFLINWKILDEPTCHRMINPSPLEVAELFKYRLIGFNNLRYDNPLVYARSQGATLDTLYNISVNLIKGGKGAVDKEITINSKRLSYLDLYDVSPTKQSLKKWEVDLHIQHKELEYDFTKPIAEEHWGEVAEYCDNDVFATEAVYKTKQIQGEIEARKILSVISGLSVNTPNNQHSAKIIFGDDKNYKSEFIYTDLRTEFPGYEFINGKSTYLGEDVGEGGAVRALPGMYENVWTFDIVSQHPHTIKALNIFGDKYTKRFYSLVELRVAVKHGDVEAVKNMFDGKLAPYLEDKSNLKTIAYALKIVINSVYGLTTAHFDNPFRDPRNVDNIVAKRGALFMLSLKHELEARGIQVIHIKTDSIKIANPSEETKQFIYNYGTKYGYTFEVEHIYKKFCLVNKAVYIAKYEEPEKDPETGEDIWWDATGAEFAKPFVYKTLFSKQPISFYDMCEVKQVQKGQIYLNFNEFEEVTTYTPKGKPKIVTVQKEDPDKLVFIGRIGSFLPVKTGGGILVAKREQKDGSIKWESVNDTKGYFWMSSEDISQDNYQDYIDRSYYDELITDAKHHIEEYGDFEAFVS